MRSLIMSDTETETEWSHLLGRGMAGKLKGKELEPLVSDMVTWSVWRKQHPETTVLDMSKTSNSFTREFYRDPARFVFGFEVQGKTFALSMDDLLKHPVHSFEVEGHPLLATLEKTGMVVRLFDARVKGKPIGFKQLAQETMQDYQTQSHWKLTGEAISGPMAGTRLEQRVGIMSFRKAWQNFHPKSRDIEFGNDR